MFIKSMTKRAGVRANDFILPIFHNKMHIHNCQSEWCVSVCERFFILSLVRKCGKECIWMFENRWNWQFLANVNIPPHAWRTLVVAFRKFNFQWSDFHLGFSCMNLFAHTDSMRIHLRSLDSCFFLFSTHIWKCSKTNLKSRCEWWCYFASSMLSFGAKKSG